ncbi:MAG: sensor histidine kinase [Victivallaceae bacterium]
MSFFRSIKPSAFASAERKDADLVQKESDFLKKEIQHCVVMDMLPDPVLIINQERQIIFANCATLDFLKLEDASSIIGARPGEALHCIHAQNDSGGCGTTEFCGVCGAVDAVLNTQQFHSNTMRDCNILTTADKAYNLRVWTRPFKKDGYEFIVVILHDIADEVYKNSLERIFFHDIINIGSGLYGLLSIIDDDPDAFKENYPLLIGLTEELLEEINSQRDLMAAEAGSMNVKLSDVKSNDILKCVADIMSRHQTAENKRITIGDNTIDINFKTDPCLLKRILINMTKNALEASSAGNTVALSAFVHGGKAVFEVHNSAYMPEDVQLQVFNRSFSTKGQGRGLGTYSAKLLGEKYLRGKVYFTSTKDDGTSFFLELPLNPEPNSTTGSL